MLLEMTGQKSVPNVFINKTHVGGCDKTLQVPTTSPCNALTTQSMYTTANLPLFLRLGS